MKKEYEELYGQMKAPTEWKNQIKEQMHAALEEEMQAEVNADALKIQKQETNQEKEINQNTKSSIDTIMSGNLENGIEHKNEKKKKKKKGSMRYLYAIGGVAAAAAVVVLAVNSGFLSTKKNMSAELLDGGIYDLAEVDSSEADSGAENAPDEAFRTEKALGDGVSQAGSGEFLVEEPSQDQIVSLGEGEITIHKEDGEQIPDDLKANGQSLEVEGVNVALSYEDMDGLHHGQAAFVMQDVTYLLSSDSVTKEVFEEYITELIKMLK